MCSQGSVVGEEHLSQQELAHFCLGSQAGQVEKLAVRSRMEKHSVFSFAEGVRQQQGEENSKECRGENASLFHAAFDRH